MTPNELLQSYRTVYPERMLNEQVIGWWSDADINEVLEKSPHYAHIRWRFLRTASMGAYQKILKSIPIVTVIDTMNTLVRPIHTDFTEMTENEEFMKVAGYFYYQLFIQETVYMSYNFFESRSNYIVPKNSDKDVRQKIEALKERGGFDVWVKLTENQLDDDIDFMHVETSLVVKIPKWRQKLAFCKWGSMYCGNFRNWLTVTVVYLMYTMLLEISLKLTNKRIIINSNTNSKEFKDRIDGIINSLEGVVHLNLQDFATLRSVEYIDGDTLTAIKDTVYHVLDRMMFEYGRVTNTNPKGERMTAAENYKDMSGIANRQKETLEYLISFAHQIKKLWGIELEFGVSGIPEKEAIQEYSHWAQNPNSQAKDFTYQTEGTDPRMPPGQPTPKRKDRGKTIKALNK